MIHPDTLVRPARREIGAGVFATRAIPRGTIVWARDPLDQVVTPERLAAYPAAARAQLERYVYRDDAGRLILCWDNARFMNHSCAPTNLVTPHGFSIAVRDTPEGGELTEDYATYHLTPEEAFDCYCGLPECRRRVGPRDAVALADEWRRAIAEALELADRVAQPLRALVPPDLLAGLRA